LSVSKTPSIGFANPGALCDYFKSRRRLEAEILVLRHLLNVLQQRAPRRPYLTWADRAREQKGTQLRTSSNHVLIRKNPPKVFFVEHVQMIGELVRCPCGSYRGYPSVLDAVTIVRPETILQAKEKVLTKRHERLDWQRFQNNRRDLSETKPH
jgi:hypothetical protein